MPVEIFSAQSLRRSVSRAQRAIACLTRAAAVRSPLRAGQRALQSPQPDPLVRDQGGAVQQLAGWTGRRRPPPPGRCPPPSPWTGGGNRRRDHRERDMPAARPVPGRPVGLCARRHRAGPAVPHPPGLRHPDLADLTGHPAHVPLPPAPPDLSGPSSRPALRHDGRPARLPPDRRTRPWPGRSHEAPAAAPSASSTGGQPRMRRPRPGKLPALLQVAGSALAARTPVPVLLDGQVPHVPGVAAVVPQHRFLGRRGEQPVPGHANTLSNTADNSREVKQPGLPRPAGRSIPPAILVVPPHKLHSHPRVLAFRWRVRSPR